MWVGNKEKKEGLTMYKDARQFVVKMKAVESEAKVGGSEFWHGFEARCRLTGLNARRRENPA